MDFLHDILALPGSTALGLAHGTSVGSLDGSAGTTSHSGLLDPLRQLLRSPYHGLSRGHEKGGQPLPDGTLDATQSQEFRVQALRARLGQVRIRRFSDNLQRLTVQFIRHKPIPNGFLQLPN